MSFEFFRADYECEAPPGIVQASLREAIGYSPARRDDTRVWISEHEWGLYRNRLEYDPVEGSLAIYRTVHSSVRYAAVTLPVLVTGGIFTSNTLVLNVGAFAGLFLVALFHELSEVPTFEVASLQSYRFPADYYLTLATTLVTFAASPGFETGFTAGAVVVALLLVGYHYARGATVPWVPSVGPSRSPTQLQIALLGCLLPVVLVLLVGLFAAVWAGLPGWAALPISVGVGIQGTLYFGTACTWHVYRLENSKLAPFPTGTIRYALLLVYALLNVLLFQVIVFAGNLVAYSFAGTTLLGIYEPGVGSVELVNLVRAEVGITVEAGTHPVDPLTAGVVMLPFLPLVVVTGCWVVSVGRGWLSHVRTTSSSETYDWEAPDGTTVPVRLVDGTVPRVAVKGLMFGFRPYIVATRCVMDELEERERTAIFAHELYHVRNHDLVVNAAATLSSLFVLGGRNAFLVFYDYPRIEREADEFAAQLTGPGTVKSALESMRTALLESKIGTDETLSGPQVTGSPQRHPTDTGKTSSPGVVGRRILEWFGLAKRDLCAIYRLFYGQIVLDNAHGPVDERIARLEELESENEEVAE